MPDTRETQKYSPKRSSGGIVRGEYVEVAQFGADHWSTLVYAESVIKDCGGFQVGFDARMRQGRQNYRVMQQGCVEPKRAGSPRPKQSAAVMNDAHGSRFKDGTYAPGHDDWHCVQDMAEAAFFELRLDEERIVAAASDVEPGAMLHLSNRGRAVADALIAHERGGGSWADFTPPRGALHIY